MMWRKMREVKEKPDKKGRFSFRILENNLNKINEKNNKFRKKLFRFLFLINIEKKALFLKKIFYMPLCIYLKDN